MKSFPRIRPHASHEQLETWNPLDLDVKSTARVQKEQILAFFRDGVESTANKKGDRSALHSGEAGQNFTTWQPNDMGQHPTVVRKDEWTFIETAEDPYKNSREALGFEFHLLGESALQEQPDLEKEVLVILERARVQAEEIILAAQTEADNMLLQAQDEIEEQKKEAYQQGWNNARLEFEEALKATRSMVEEVRTWQTELMSQGEHILIEMLKDISQKMFGEGIELDTNALQLNLNRIMENAQGLGDLNIYLNPRDAKVLDPSWSEYQMLVSGDKVKIIPSGKITPGGCFVKGNMGTVDGRVETQLSAILKTFDEPNELAE